MNSKQHIINYLRKKYSPDAILLIGSRMKGTHTEDSDWDIFMVGSEKKGSFYEEWDGETLDVTCKEWPVEDKPLTTPLQPLWPVEVLYANNLKKLELVLQTTQSEHRKGPLFTDYKNGVHIRHEKIQRYVDKIKKYHKHSRAQFFYAGIFYEFAIRTWFELQNRWSSSPKEAFEIMTQEDLELAKLFNDFCDNSPENRPHIAQRILEKIEYLEKS